MIALQLDIGYVATDFYPAVGYRKCSELGDSTLHADAEAIVRGRPVAIHFLASVDRMNTLHQQRFPCLPVVAESKRL